MNICIKKHPQNWDVLAKSNITDMFAQTAKEAKSHATKSLNAGLGI